MPNTEVARRYRCGACGGLTRFAVRLTRTITYFHHQAIDGSMMPEDEEVINEVVEEVKCVYCGHGNNIEVMEGSDTD